MLPSGSAQYAITCVSLRVLIQIAYDTRYVDGGGSALDNFYDVRATLPDGKTWTPEGTRPMLQHLLEERFHLVAHGGKRQLSGYDLVVAKGGPRLHAVPAPASLGQKAGEPSANFIMADRIQGRGVGASSIATLISVAVHAPVVDRTGLTGTYNLDLKFAPDNDPDPNAPSLFTAVEEQLGLQLKAQKITVDTLVIDHADESPTPN